MPTNADVKKESTNPQPTAPPKRTRTTMSKKANLTFPVARVDRLLREGNYSSRYSKTASVYLTSVLECLSGEIIKKAGQATLDAGRVVIAPKDVLQGIQQDTRLTKLVGGQNNFYIANSK